MKKSEISTKILVAITIFMIIYVAYLIHRNNNYEKIINENKNYTKDEKIEEVISENYIREILNINRLNTYRCTYNGVCTIKEDNKSTFYCLYNSNVTLGMDFSKLDISMSDKNINITMPNIEINNIYIDLSKFEYMNIDNKYNTDMIFKEAYNTCLEDISKKCLSDYHILNLAEEESKNTIKSILSPFIDENEYNIVIEMYNDKKGVDSNV